MADEFDPCECVFNQFGSMQRLLAMMRDGQSHCTDSECTDDALPGNTEGLNPTTIILALWLVMAMVMFLVRPSGVQRRDTEPAAEKPSALNSNDDDQPPPVM